MRIFPLAAMLLAACSQDPTAAGLVTGTYAGEGRDRLCIAGERPPLRAGLIVYGAGDTNCSASGRIVQAEFGWVLVPQGEGDCRIPLTISGDRFRIGQPPAPCAYYCGPGAMLEGKQFASNGAATPATDLAGDPLC